MRTIPIGPEDQINFDGYVLEELIAEGIFRGTERLPHGEDMGKLGQPYDVVIRWENTVDHYLPDDTQYLHEYVAEWYEPQLDRLHHLGIGALPHHTYIVDTETAVPPTLYTVTPYIPDLHPLYNIDAPEAWRESHSTLRSIHQLLGILGLQYFAKFDPSAPQIADIHSPRQYMHGNDEEGMVATLFDLDHGFLTHNAYTATLKKLEAQVSKFFVSEAA